MTGGAPAAAPRRPGDSPRHRRQRRKNVALALVIAFVMAMIYVLYLVRQAGAA